MSEILRDEQGQIIKPESQTAAKVPFDNDFINELTNAVAYKIDKKTRESRAFLKAKELDSAKKSVENLENVSRETKQSPIKQIIGLGILIFVGFCGFKVWQNVKKSQ